MIGNKEKNFISAIIYLHNNEKDVLSFVCKISEALEKKFEKYELIAINNACTDDTMAIVKKWAKSSAKPLTIVNMSTYQSKELCMNAGIDMSIGDYVFEFDCICAQFEESVIFTAYETATLGSDIVSVCPKNVKGFSNLFYKLFNKSSHSLYPLRTDIFRLVSRRAINRVYSISDYLPYRKAAYAASGLKMSYIELDGDCNYSNKEKGRAELAVNSLILYTDAMYKISAKITLLMFLIAVIELIYSVVVFFIGNPIEGWTTTMIVLTIGFAGLFFILTIAIKYLSLLIDITFKKQKYLVEGIEKIQK